MTISAGERGYWHGVGEVPWSWGRSVVTLGVFDGVHLGHARVLERAVDLVGGENFRFGHRGAGDGRLLARLGVRHGFSAHTVPLLKGCSSTRVRELVATGDVTGAAWILGRPHRVRGAATRGHVTFSGPTLLPPCGLYRVRLDGAGVTARVDPRGVTLDRAVNGRVDLDFADSGEMSQ